MGMWRVCVHGHVEGLCAWACGGSVCMGMWRVCVYEHVEGNVQKLHTHLVPYMYHNQHIPSHPHQHTPAAHRYQVTPLNKLTEISSLQNPHSSIT